MQIKERTFSYHHAQSSLYECQSDTTHITHWESRIQQETYTSHFQENHIDTTERSALIRIFSILIYQYTLPMTAVVLFLVYAILPFITYVFSLNIYQP